MTVALPKLFRKKDKIGVGQTKLKKEKKIHNYAYNLPAVDDGSNGVVAQKKELQALVKQESPQVTTEKSPGRRGSIDKCCHRFV